MRRLPSPCPGCKHPEMCREYDLCTEGKVKYREAPPPVVVPGPPDLGYPNSNGKKKPKRR